MEKFMKIITTPFILATIYLSSISVPGAQAENVKYCNLGITDDAVAKSIRPPQPHSVSEAIESIKGKHKGIDIEALDFSDNSIAMNGATQILEFADTLPNLVKLSFHTNHIYDWRGSADYEPFEVLLIKLIKKKEIKRIDLRKNNIANATWFNHILEKAGDAAFKIKWQNN